MRSKLESLLFLEGKGLNVHNYIVVDSRDFKNKLMISRVLQQLFSEVDYCTVRFDNDTGKIKDLPFIKIEKDKWGWHDCELIRENMERYGSRAIISNGLGFDKYMIFNMCCNLTVEGDFYCELSYEKIPLRTMYKKSENLIQVYGNIAESIFNWTVRSSVSYDLRDIRRWLTEIYSKGIFNKYIECTTYSERVGKQKEYIVFWQIC